MTAPPPEPPDLRDAPPEPDPFTAPDIDHMVRHNRAEVERALLTQIIHDPDPGQALLTVQPDDFQIGTHKKLWETLRRLDADRAPINLITVTEALEADGSLEHVGGIAAIVDLLTGWDFLAPASHLAEKVADAARRQRLIDAGRTVAKLAETGDVDVAQVEDLLRPQLPEHDRGIESAWDVLEEILDRHANPEREAGERLGWREVDQLYRIAPGLMSIVTGIPGSGKSSWVDAATIRLAERDDWRFAVFSPESAPTSRHVLNLVSIHSGMNYTRLTVPQLHEQIDWIHSHYTWVRSTDAVTVTEILRRADIIRRRGQLNGLVIDPWNEIDHTRPDSVSETQHISASLTRLRRWGRRHNIHIWLIAHPRKQDRRTDGSYSPPGLYEITGSATWNDKADMGVVVHRDKTKPGPVNVHIVKVRFREHGRVGTARLHFDVPTGRYFDLHPAEHPAHLEESAA